MHRLISPALTAIRVIHLGILLFIVCAWAFPFKLIWQIHLIAVPVTILQWQLNGGTCVLTNLENCLRGEEQDREKQQGQFIKSLLGRFCNPLPADRTIQCWIYGIMAAVWATSAVRLYLVWL